MGYDKEMDAILSTLAVNGQKQIVNADSTDEYRSKIQFTTAESADTDTDTVTLEAYKIAAFMRSAIDTESIPGTKEIFYESPVQSFINDTNKLSAVWAALVQEFRCAVCTDFAHYIYTYMIENSYKYVYFCEREGHAFVITSPNRAFSGTGKYDITEIFIPRLVRLEDSYIVDPWKEHKLIRLNNIKFNETIKEEISWYNNEFAVIQESEGNGKEILEYCEKTIVKTQINALKQFINKNADAVIETPKHYPDVVNKNLVFWDDEKWKYWDAAQHQWVDM
jgi:hypothetical protein